MSALPEAAAVASEARREAVAAAKTAEDKSGPVVQTALTLLTIAVALGAYQLKFAFDRRGWSYLTVGPVGGSLVCLALAAFEATEVNRVGFYKTPNLRDLASRGVRSAGAALLAAEDEGRFLARWTAEHKHSALMQAKAWFSRGLALLLVAGIVAGVSRAGATSPAEERQVTTTTSTSRADTTTTEAPTTTSVVTRGPAGSQPSAATP